MAIEYVDSAQLDDDLASIANAIRAKSGGSSQLAFPADFVSEIGNIPSGGGGPQWELIGTYTTYLAEYTDTSNLETNDTGINISDTDYAWFLTVITCDTAITTTSEWGMTIGFGGRYTSNGNYNSCGAVGQRGSATLSKSAMVANSIGFSSYGVWLPNNTSAINFCRKCHGTACPKCRAGNYTVKVYGLKSL